MPARRTAPKPRGAAPPKFPPVTATSPWPPRPLDLADWPLAFRQQWGERANALEDGGLAWNEAERKAYLEVRKALEKERMRIDE